MIPASCKSCSCTPAAHTSQLHTWAPSLEYADVASAHLAMTVYLHCILSQAYAVCYRGAGPSDSTAVLLMRLLEKNRLLGAMYEGNSTLQSCSELVGIELHVYSMVHCCQAPESSLGTCVPVRPVHFSF